MPQNHTEKLVTMMLQTSRMLHKRLRATAAHERVVSPPQMCVLHCALERRGNGLSMKELAEILRITPPSATQLTARLVDDGLLKRAQSTGDRRGVRLAITPRGRRLYEKQVQNVSDGMRAIVEKLSPEEQKNFYVILEKMHSICLQKNS